MQHLLKDRRGCLEELWGALQEGAISLVCWAKKQEKDRESEKERGRVRMAPQRVLDAVLMGE